MAYAVLRFEKHKTNEIHKVYKHQLRTMVVPNSDPNMISKNEYDIRLTKEQYMERLKELKKNFEERHGKKLRKDVVAGIEVLLTFSPEQLEGFTEDGKEAWLREWKRANITWLEETFQADNIAFISLHKDEKTPHISALIVPNVNGELRATYWLDGKEKCQALQDSYAESMKILGLERGIKGSKAKHTQLRDFHKRVASADTTADTETIKAKAIGYDLLQKQIKAKDIQIKSLQEENRMLQKELEQKEITQKLRDLDLVEVMTRLGYEKDETRSDNYRSVYNTQVGKISIMGSKFFNFHTNKGGGGAIDLVMLTENCTFKEAVARLKSVFSDEEIKKATAIHLIKRGIDAVDRTKQIKGPTKDYTKTHIVRDYLLKKRNLPVNIVDKLINKDIIFANSFGSCVFCCMNQEGEVTGYEIRGTTTYFKQRIGSKSEGWFYLGDLKTAKKVVLVESAIDAISYKALKNTDNDTCVLSLNGNLVPDKLIEIIKDKQVVLATDNDTKKIAKQTTEQQFSKLKEKVTTVIRELPTAKDWNEMLQNIEVKNPYISMG